MKKTVVEKKKVVYQIISKKALRTANGDGIGDLKGILEKLPYLKKSRN